MKKALYIVNKTSANQLILERNRSRYLKEFLASIFFLLIWCWGLFKITVGEHNIENPKQFIFIAFAHPFLWVFWIAAIGILVKAVKLLRMAIIGENLIFDKSLNSFLINSNHKCSISDIKNIQIREFVDSDNDHDYRLSLVTYNNNKIFIDRATNKNDIMEMSEEIADFLNLSVIIKK